MAENGEKHEEEELDEEFFELLRKAQETGDYKTVEELTVKMFERAARYVESHEPNETDIWREQALQLMIDGMWHDAEVLWLRLIERHHSVNERGNLLRDAAYLSSMYRALGRHEEAYEMRLVATNAARQCSCTPILLEALINQALFEMQRGDIEKTRQLAAEAQEVDDTLKGGPFSNLQRWQVRLVRAWCDVMEGQLDQARQALEEVQVELWPEAENMPWAAGVWSAGVLCCRVGARLSAAEGNVAEEVECLKTACEMRRHIAMLPHPTQPFPQFALVAALKEYGEALLRSGNMVDGELTLAECRAYRKQLHLP